MFEFTAIHTTPENGNAKDARTKEPIGYRTAVRVFVPQTVAARYFLPETWAERTPLNDCRAVVVGKSTKQQLRYFVSGSVEMGDALHAALIAANGSQPVWFATEDGFASPTYRNMKWHDRLNLIEEGTTKGTLTVEITTEDGREVDTLTIKWGKRDELGRFIKKDERGKSLLLKMVAETVKAWEKANR